MGLNRDNDSGEFGSHFSTNGLLGQISDNRLFAVFFVLLVLKVLPGPNGNRIMGGIVWLTAGCLFLGWAIRCYGPPSKWVGLAINWMNANRVTAFLWALLVGGLFISSLCAVFSIQQYPDGTPDHWMVTEKERGSASIQTVYDDHLQRNVVAFSGAEEGDFFQAANPLYRKRMAFEPLIIKWQMKFDSPFKILIRVNTIKGARTLVYTPENESPLVIRERPRVVHYGLGEDTANGAWHTIVRDVKADLRQGYPGAEIIKLEYFRVYGNGRLDDQGLMKALGWAWKNQRLPLTLLISALASYMFVFLTYWLFCLSRDDKGYRWALVLMILVNAIPLWQKFDLDAVRFLLQYTVADDALNQHEISSVLRAVTTYSPFAAVLSIFFWGRFLLKKSVGMTRYAECLIGVLAMAGSLLAGSRTGILTLLMGLLALVCYVPGRGRWWIICLVLVAVSGVHVFAVLNPYLGKKMGMVLPYINKLRHHESVRPADFVPDFSAGYSDKKVNRWVRIKEAFSLWRQHPWLGVGLGQYSILSGHKWIGNVHNLFLNILCETGVFVFFSWMCLSGLFIWRRRHSFLTAVVVSIFVISCFENLFDHSMPWALTCAWILSREDNPAL